MPRTLEGRVALVTGASRGIGRATAIRLARDGAYVVVNHAAEADARFPGAAAEALRLVREAGGDGELFDTDVAHVASLQQMLREVDARHGRLDILVNNAGICPMVELFDITQFLWDRVHGVNLRAVFFATQEAARLMIARGLKGRIICISSIAGEIGTPTQIHYCPTKAGVNMIVKSIASVVGPAGITINAVAPGDIATDISREWDEANPEEIERYIQRCPVRRRGVAGDVAAVVAFLASDEASFVNGSVYVVDGGLTSVM